MTIELRPALDLAKHIREPEDQAELIADALASGDRGYVAHALGIVARAQGGVAQLADRIGMKRQALDRALSKDGNPTLETLLKVLSGLGMQAAVTIGKRAA